MSTLKFPGVVLLELVPTLFAASEWKTEKPFHFFDMGNGMGTFCFAGADHVSDSADELVEIAVREIEKVVTAKIAENVDGRPYITVQLTCGEDGPDIDICDSFTVLERPWRVELYTDTFRRGVATLRKLKEAK